MPDDPPVEPPRLIFNDLEKQFEVSPGAGSNMTSETMPRFGGTKGPNQEVRIEIDGDEVPIRTGGGDFSELDTWETIDMWSLGEGKHTFKMTTRELRTNEANQPEWVDGETVEHTFEVLDPGDAAVNWQATRNRAAEEANWAQTEGAAMRAGEQVLPPPLLDPGDHGFGSTVTPASDIEQSRDRDLRRRRDERDARLQAQATEPPPGESTAEKDFDEFLAETRDREAKEAADEAASTAGQAGAVAERAAAIGAEAAAAGGGANLQGSPPERAPVPPEPIPVPQAPGAGAGGGGQGGGQAGGQQGGQGQSGGGQAGGQAQGGQSQGQQSAGRPRTGGPPGSGPVVIGIEKGNGVRLVND
jgi:hypothetical protein